MQNIVNKKIKVTHYFSKQENDMLMQLYATAIAQSNRKDKSELIGEAIRMLFKDGYEKLNQLSAEKHRQLNDAAKNSQGLSVPVPLDKQQARVLSQEDLDILFGFYKQRERLEEEVQQIDYLLFLYKKLLEK